ncbi:MAG: methyltransferase family protein [Pseudomonas sp.]
MHPLELKIPPLGLVGLIAVLMWGLAWLFSPVYLPAGFRTLAILLCALAGLGFALGGVLAFRRAGTTVDPMSPGKSSALVTDGVYRVSRNPMYVGFVFALIAWGLVLSAPWAMVGPVLFVLYMNRYQILPEERILLKRFGADYAEYKGRVRRWL